MPVICISRELGGGGEKTARELAEIGGYRFIEREVIEANLTKHNLTRETLVHYDEKKPGFWAALSENRDRYAHYLTEGICNEAAAGNCIILGRGAVAVLQGIAGVVCVRLVAPKPVRIARLQEIYSYDARTAEQQIKQSDSNRQGFHKYFFEVDWQDPLMYHLTLNTGKLSFHEAALTIEKCRQIIVSPEEEAESKIRLEELRLKNIVIGEVLFTRRIQIQEFSVGVSGSDLTLMGCAVSNIAARNAMEAARGIPGVGNITNNIMVVPPVVTSN
ncbi:MAG: cytidylate kinase family protein [Spirochaetales bacterium]|jgi:cytidylate kinase|nr:cytidylate kinase family protein [Spirochaetales bacterium]